MAADYLDYLPKKFQDHISKRDMHHYLTWAYSLICLIIHALLLEKHSLNKPQMPSEFTINYKLIPLSLYLVIYLFLIINIINHRKWILLYFKRFLYEKLIYNIHVSLHTICNPFTEKFSEIFRKFSTYTFIKQFYISWIILQNKVYLFFFCLNKSSCININ